MNLRRPGFLALNVEDCPEVAEWAFRESAEWAFHESAEWGFRESAEWGFRESAAWTHFLRRTRRIQVLDSVKSGLGFEALSVCCSVFRSLRRRAFCALALTDSALPFEAMYGRTLDF